MSLGPSAVATVDKIWFNKLCMEEKKRTNKKHLTARCGIGSEEDGIHLEGNCDGGGFSETPGHKDVNQQN